ncbi:nucleic acid binding [Elasticomyces elasticus]|uniref:C2H2-type domain-containing protein n=1 Tax=Exophiala sideris TaxID=1016849 RepID=A0ABR0JL46_9EURO|nr:nucleic acid binding [Elasticomyces elasticus]KAK5041838.1 nucleic acid binding [Exophiala sideris]KAK5066714.1 hypothetical protein LTR69_002061 [Exophiala sideris]KAK5184772.1 hypothetical protein LTR44_002618 [Eurotiomycetes sp. CCFEE 6388]
MYCGKSDFTTFRLDDVLDGIDNLLNDRPVQITVRDFIQNAIHVSINKVRMSQDHRDNRILMPRKRNHIDPDSDEEGSGKPKHIEVLDYDNTAKSKRRQTANNGASGNERFDLVEVDDSFVCPEKSCSEWVPDIRSLVKHLSMQSKTVGHCVLCHITFKNYSKHVLVHLPPQFECPEKCGIMFRTPSSLNSHLAAHARQKSEEAKSTTKAWLRWKCQDIDCVSTGLAFATKTELDEHIEAEHDASDHASARFSCDCGSDFANKYLLKRHQDTSCKKSRAAADVLLKYKCPWESCGQTFDSHISINYHYKTAHQREEEVLGVAIRAGMITEENRPRPLSATIMKGSRI